MRSAILSTKKRIRGKRVVYEKRIFIVVLALLVCLATAVWADGQDEAGAAGKVELDFDTHMFNYEPWNGMIQTVVDKYMELNPDVIINVRGGDWAEARETLLTMAAAGDAVDIMNFDADWHVSLAAAGVLTDLRGSGSARTSGGHECRKRSNRGDAAERFQLF